MAHDAQSIQYSGNVLVGITCECGCEFTNGNDLGIVKSFSGHISTKSRGAVVNAVTRGILQPAQIADKLMEVNP